MDRPSKREVPGTDGIPLPAFVVLSIFIAVLAGPLNLWWCRKRKREYFLFTTPVIGVGASLVLIITAFISDGVSIKRSSSGAYILSDGS